MTVAPVPGNGPFLFQARRTELSVIKLQLNCHDKGKPPRECSERAGERMPSLFPAARRHTRPPRPKTTNLPIQKSCCAWQQNRRAHVRLLGPTVVCAISSGLGDGGASVGASTIGEIDAAFATMGRERADALIVAPKAFFASRRVQTCHPGLLERLFGKAPRCT